VPRQTLLIVPPLPPVAVGRDYLRSWPCLRKRPQIGADGSLVIIMSAPRTTLSAGRLALRHRRVTQAD